eukprot:EST46080.1 ATP-dependent RNA helicase DHH1 [Spironucleus salmonicida]
MSLPTQDNREQTEDIRGSGVKFSQLNLKPYLVTSLQAVNFITATPIQEKTIPIALTLVDIVARAKNGTGKTGAFLIPILNQIKPQINTIQAVIVVNTRELAMQISSVTQNLGKLVNGVQNRVMCLVGGNSHGDDIMRINQYNPSILIATTLKLRVFLQEKLINLSQTKILVADEADKIIQQHEPLADLLIIKSHMHKDHQTMIFSATYQSEVQQFTQLHMTNPEFINCQQDKLTLSGITQYVAQVRQQDLKFKLLMILFKHLQIRQAIIFVNSTQRCEQIHHLVQSQLEIPSSFVHSKLTQFERSKVFHEFSQQNTRILVATDLYTRGIDIRTVNVVINFDVPRYADDYLHRIGRCGRFGHKGLAITFQSGPAELETCQAIDEMLNSPMIPLPSDLKKIPNSQYAILDSDIKF